MGLRRPSRNQPTGIGHLGRVAGSPWVHSHLGRMAEVEAKLCSPSPAVNRSINGGNDETICHGCRAVNICFGLCSGRRHLSNQSGRQGWKAAGRGGTKELHDQMHEGRLRTKGDRQEWQAARRRREVKLPEEMRERSLVMRAEATPKRRMDMRATFVAILGFALTGLCAASSPVLAQQKTEKACKSEWQANKADNQAKRITEKAYVDQCRSGSAATTPAATPAAAKPAPTTVAPAPKATSSSPTAPAVKPAPTAVTTTAGANEFSSEAQAKSRCPTDTVVWANLK